METVGIIGTGEIGSRMARLLSAAKYPVVCFDKRPEALRRPKLNGAQIAANVSELAEKSDVVITCVTDGYALEDVIAGPGGLLATLAGGKTIIDTTSAEPWITQKLAPSLGARGIAFLDAPVSGGVPAADSGRMNFMVGGDAAVLAKYKPLLAHLGPTIKYVGQVGLGHTLKAVNMMALAAAMLGTAEVIAVGCARGFRLKDVVEDLDAGPGASFCTRVHFPKFIIPGGFDSGFSFDLMYKDLAIAVQLADRLQVPLFAGRTVFELYRAAAIGGYSGKDNTRIVDLVSSFETGSGRPCPETAELLEVITSLNNNVVAGEAVVLGLKAGIALETMVEVMSAGSGASAALTGRTVQHFRGQSAPAQMSLTGALRRYANIAALGFEAAVPLYVTGQIAAAFAAAGRKFGGDTASDRVLDVWRNGEAEA